MNTSTSSPGYAPPSPTLGPPQDNTARNVDNNAHGTPHIYRSTLHNQRAEARYSTMSESLTHTELPDYLGHARARLELLCPGLWNHLINSQLTKAAFTDLTTAASHVTPAIEQSLYNCVDNVLNTISGEVVKFVRSQPKNHVKLSFGREGTVVWYPADERHMIGGFPNADIATPDHVSFLVPPELETSIEEFAQTLPNKFEDKFGEPLGPSWQATVSIAEDKISRDDEMEQHKAYTTDHSKFRVDYPVVRGFAVDRDKDTTRLRLTGMNARGFWSSLVQPIDNHEAWVAHVCEVYEAHARRIRNIESLDVFMQVFHRFTIEGQVMIIAPIFAKPPPGCKTFIGFRLDIPGDTQPCEKHVENSTIAAAYRSSPATELFKFSWHDRMQSFCHEKAMYETAHRGSWNPGLARHRLSGRLDEFAVKDFDFAATADVDKTLVPEFLTLESIGEPLSACRTPRELFEVIFDTCLTLEDLLAAGVLHRDLSGGNIMCHPRHRATDSASRNSAQDRYCIDYVLANDTKTHAYKCLIVDLDHAALLVQSVTRADESTSDHGTHAPGSATTQRTGPAHLTGTPMFMALDLQFRGKLDYSRTVFPLPEYFRPTPRHSTEASEAFERAFSCTAAKAHGYDAWHAELYDSSVFESQLNALHGHLSSQVFTERTIHVAPSSSHQLRHDIESCFWVLYFYLARALPVGGCADPKELNTYSYFVNDILLDDGSGRKKLNIRDHKPENVLHQDIKQLGDVLVAIRDYLLATPWQLMEDDPDFPRNLRLHPAHAAVTLRRIILNALTDPRLQTPLNVRLRNDIPRDPFLDPHANKSKSASHSVSTSGTKQRANSSKPAESLNSNGKRTCPPSARLSEKRIRSSDGSFKVERDLVDTESEVASDSTPAALPDAESSSTSGESAETQARLIWTDAMWYSVSPVVVKP